MKTEPHFRIIEKQAFIAAVPMYIKNTDGTQMPVSVQALTDLQVQVKVKNGAEVYAYTVSRDVYNNVLLDFAQGVGCYVYSVLVTAKLGGREIRTYYQEAFEGVKYNRDTTFENFITGDTITLPDSVFVLSADTSAVAALSEQLQQAIATAEAAKAEYEQKLHDLQGVAQEATSQQILYDVEHIDFDKSDLAKQGNNAAATNTAIYEKLGDVVMMTEAELQPALDDLEEMLDELN